MSQTPTERWSDRQYSPKQSAYRAFDAPGYPNSVAAINAVISNFGTRPGVTHPDDNSLFVTMEGLSARNNGGPTTWIVGVGYKYLAAADGQDLTPLDRRTRWDIDIGTATAITDHDIYGNPLANAAGGPYEPAPFDIATIVVTARKYFPNFSINYALRFLNHVNYTPVTLTSFGTLGPLQLKCTAFTPTTTIILTQELPIEVMIRFEVRNSRLAGQPNDPGFVLRKKNQGFRGFFQDSSGKVQQGDFSIPDPTHETIYINVTEPVLLDEVGRPIDSRVRIGEGKSPQTPVAAPPNTFGVPDPQLVRRTKGPAGVTFMEFIMDQPTDFGELFAALS